MATGCEKKLAKKFAEKKFKENFKDHDVMIYNEYENEVTEIRLSEVPDIIEEKKLILTEAGVLFKPRGEVINLNADIQEFQLDSRGYHKKLMFKYAEEKNSIMQAYENSVQARLKKQANSGYGAKGNPMSFLNSFNASSATTGAGRGQTSMTAQCYENLLMDSVKFFNLDEMFAYITNIINEKKDNNFILEDVINVWPTRKELVDRMMKKFHKTYTPDKSIVSSIIDKLSKEEFTRVYFKSNIEKFFEQKIMIDLYNKISEHSDPFNDPNELPEGIGPEIVLFGELTNEFVNYKYQPFRYEDRAKYEMRHCVPIMDTDSNVVYIGLLRKYVRENMLKKLVPENDKDFLKWDVKIRNVISYVTTVANQEAIWYYLGTVGVDENIRHRIKQKNEFSFPMVIVATAMKSYLASIDRQESVIFDKLKPEVKGLAFMKSTATKKTSDFIYDELLMTKLLNPNNGTINIPDVIDSIVEYRKKMIDEISSGDLSYIKNVKIKPADGYKDPMSISQYKASYIWNQLCDEADKFEYPAVSNMVKVKLNSKKDLALLEDFPEIYEKMEKLMDDPEINGFKNFDPTKGGKFKPKGITSIAVPVFIEKLPDWLIPLIDTATIANNNMSLFSQLYKPLGISSTRVRHGGTKANLKYYTNAVKI